MHSLRALRGDLQSWLCQAELGPLGSCMLQVRAEYIALYKQYAPLWEKEETERTARWNRFLADFKPKNSR